MHNIELAAQLLNGVMVMPGQEFSFNSEIGAMTEDAGFQIAYGIVNNDGELRTIPTEAGGICQVATTVFQPVFATGYDITQRSTHSYWIPSYSFNGMVGLDATVDPASGLDLKWVNNSEHAVLIQAVADGENFTVRLIGQPPGWEVRIDEPVITNIQWADQETIFYEPDTALEPGETVRVERAHDGFDVKVGRTVIRADGSESYWADEVTYGKARNVVLVGSEDGELPEGYGTE
jgi:vancomycin resistance protein YoaR